LCAAHAKIAIARTLPAVVGYGTALAILAGVFDYTGGAFTGPTYDPTVDEVARKEYLRKNKRRPIQETIAELGEGRGIFTVVKYGLSIC
jgi:hypothetical protein